RREGSLDPAAEVRLEDLAPGDALDGPPDGALESVAARMREGVAGVAGRPGVRDLPRRRAFEQALGLVDRIAAAPGVGRLERPAPAVPKEDPVVERQAEIGQGEVVGRRDRDRFELGGELVAEIAEERPTRTAPGVERRFEEIEAAPREGASLASGASGRNGRPAGSNRKDREGLGGEPMPFSSPASRPAVEPGEP